MKTKKLLFFLPTLLIGFVSLPLLSSCNAEKSTTISFNSGEMDKVNNYLEANKAVINNTGSAYISESNSYDKTYFIPFLQEHLTIQNFVNSFISAFIFYSSDVPSGYLSSIKVTFNSHEVSSVINTYTSQLAEKCIEEKVTMRDGKISVEGKTGDLILEIHDAEIVDCGCKTITKSGEILGYMNVINIEEKDSSGNSTAFDSCLFILSNLMYPVEGHYVTSGDMENVYLYGFPQEDIPLGDGDGGTPY
jgi:hypothetical protein